MWKTPVLSRGGVLKVMENDLLASSFASHMRGACVALWRMRTARPSISGRSWTPVTTKPCSSCPQKRAFAVPLDISGIVSSAFLLVG